MANKENSIEKSGEPSFVLGGSFIFLGYNYTTAFHTGNKYDLETYGGRTRNFFEMFNPILLFTSDQQLNDCKTLLNQYKENKFSRIDAALNSKLWDAQMRIS